jgi:hypothetical protein
MSKNTRRCLVNRFPFGVIYQVKSSFVSIIAVADLRRRPDYWIEREWAETTLWHAVYATLGLDMAGKQVYKLSA